LALNIATACLQAFTDTSDHGVKLVLNFVLPESKYLPAMFSQFRVDSLIAPDSLRQLFLPELLVRLWMGRVQRASMPKTTIDKYRDPMRGED
jgi:hypothetical protein